MVFCTKCGHKNEGDGYFCEECGQPLKRVTPAQPKVRRPGEQPVDSANLGASSGSTSRVQGAGKKIAFFAGIGAVSIVIVGGVMAYVLGAPSPSNDLFAGLAEKAIVANPSAYKSRYCLSNFAYDKDPAFVRAMDFKAISLMAVLTKAGLYSKPEYIFQSNGLFNRTQIKYQKTEDGKKVTDGRFLCFADGVTVKSVDSFTPPTKVGDMEVSRATMTLQLKNPAPWVIQGDAKLAGINVQLEFQDDRMVFALKEGEWVLATDADMRVALASRREEAQSKSASNPKGAGFFSSLMKMFGGLSNPLIGHWKSTVMGVDVAKFEFAADSMTHNGSHVKVRYEVTDKEVTVYYQDENEPGMVFRVVDANTMIVDSGAAEFKIKRIN